MEPSGNGLVVGECGSLAGKAHEDVLGDLLGEAGVTDLPVGGGEDQVHMLADQGTKRRFRSFGGVGPHQVAVGRRGCGGHFTIILPPPIQTGQTSLEPAQPNKKERTGEGARLETEPGR